MNIVDIPNGKKISRTNRFIMCSDCPIKPMIMVVINSRSEWHRYLYDHYRLICLNCKDKEWIENNE